MTAREKKKLINHVRRWNMWRKNNMNHPFYQFLVLIGVRKSPTLPFVVMKDDTPDWDWFAIREEYGIDNVGDAE